MSVPAGQQQGAAYRLVNVPSPPPGQPQYVYQVPPGGAAAGSQRVVVPSSGTPQPTPAQPQFRYVATAPPPQAGSAPAQPQIRYVAAAPPPQAGPAPAQPQIRYVAAGPPPQGANAQVVLVAQPAQQGGNPTQYIVSPQQSVVAPLVGGVATSQALRIQAGTPQTTEPKRSLKQYEKLSPITARQRERYLLNPSQTGPSLGFIENIKWRFAKKDVHDYSIVTSKSAVAAASTSFTSLTTEDDDASSTVFSFAGVEPLAGLADDSISRADSLASSMRFETESTAVRNHDRQSSVAKSDERRKHKQQEKHRRISVGQYLLNSKLKSACRERNAAKLNQILKDAHIDPNTIVSWRTRRTILQFCAINDSQDCAKSIIQAGAALDYRDYEGKTAFFLALELGHMQFAEMLSFYGANPSFRDLYDRCILDVVSEKVKQQAKDIVKRRTRPFMEAKQSNSFENAKNLLDSGFDMRLSDFKGRTLLHKLAKWHTKQPNEPNHPYEAKVYYRKLARLLIEKGARVLAPDVFGRTPLHYASGSSKHTTKYTISGDMVALLLSYGADVNTKDYNDCTPLHFATFVKIDDPSVVNLLLNRHANPNARTLKWGATPLHIATYLNNIEVIRALLKNSADPDVLDNGTMKPIHRFDQTTIGEQGVSIVHNLYQQYQKGPKLMNALKNGDYQAANDLITDGADINFQDPRGRTIMHYAVEEGLLEAIEFLMDLGVNIKIKDRNGDTPVDICRQIDTLDPKIGNRVLAYNNLQTLVEAAASGNDKEVKRLIDLGVDVDEPMGGRIALNEAAKFGKLNCVIILCEHATLDLVSNGQAPIHSAAQNGHTECLEALLKHGADINLKDHSANGFTPCHYAVQYLHTRCVEVLCRLGADLTVLDKNNRTPLQLCQRTIEMNSTCSQQNKAIIANIEKIVMWYNNGRLLLSACERGDYTEARQLLENDELRKLLYKSQQDVAIDLEHVATSGVLNLLLSPTDQKLFISIVNYLTPEGKKIVRENAPTVYRLDENLGKSAVEMVAAIIKLGKSGVPQPDSRDQVELTKYFQELQSCFNRVVPKPADQPDLVNFRDTEGRTPLHYAVRSGNTCVSLLLDKGADTEINDNRSIGVFSLVEPDSDIESILNRHRHGTTLIYEARKGNRTNAQKILENYPFTVNFRNVDGETALFVAVSENKSSVVDLLLSVAADPNICSKEVDYPLHVAVQNANVESVELLLKYSANPLVKNKSGLTPLELLEEKSKSPVSGAANVQVAKQQELIKQRLVWAECGMKLIEAACKGSKSDVMTLYNQASEILKRQDDSRLASSVYAIGSSILKYETNDKCTALHKAVEFGHIPVIKYLLEQSADVSCVNKAGLTPLDLAKRGNNQNISNLLIQYTYGNRLIDACKNSQISEIVDLCRKYPPVVAFQDATGATALHWCAKLGLLESLDALLGENVRIDIPNKQGNTPLHIAVRANQPACVERLIRAADEDIENKSKKINAQNDRNLTPLTVALLMQPSNKRIIKALIAAGADPNTCDMDKRTPLIIAAMDGDYDIIHQIIDKLSKLSNQDALRSMINLEDVSRQTALHMAVASGNTDCVKELVGKRANPNTINVADETPLMLAARKNNTELLEVLLQNGADPNFANKLGATALHYAALENAIDCVRVLIAMNADANQGETGQSNKIKIDAEFEVGSHSLTPLHLALLFGHTNCVRLLLRAGASTTKFLGKKLVDHATDPELKNYIQYYKESSKVMKAAERGDNVVIKTKLENSRNKFAERLAMLQQSANSKNQKQQHTIQLIVQFKDEQTGNTALHVAAEKGHANCCIPLLSLGGADMNLMNKDKKTPKDLAKNQAIRDIMERHARNLELLELAKDSSETSIQRIQQILDDSEHSQDDDIYTTSRSLASTMKMNLGVYAPGTRTTPLHVAAGTGNVAFIKLFVEHHSYEQFIDEQNLNGDTALHLAASGTSEQHAQCAELLISYGADTSIVNMKGLTAKRVAQKMDENSIVCKRIKQQLKTKDGIKTFQMTLEQQIQYYKLKEKDLASAKLMTLVHAVRLKLSEKEELKKKFDEERTKLRAKANNQNQNQEAVQIETSMLEADIKKSEQVPYRRVIKFGKLKDKYPDEQQSTAKTEAPATEQKKLLDKYKETMEQSYATAANRFDQISMDFFDEKFKEMQFQIATKK